MTDINHMQIGQVVDFCIVYNNRQIAAEKAAEQGKARPRKRKANQNDINAFFG